MAPSPSDTQGQLVRFFRWLEQHTDTFDPVVQDRDEWPLDQDLVEQLAREFLAQDKATWDAILARTS